VVQQNTPVNISGSGFLPGSSVAVYFFSEPNKLGYATVGNDGSFDSSLALPAGLELGNHTLALQGISASGKFQEAQAPVLLNQLETLPLSIRYGPMQSNLQGSSLIQAQVILKAIAGLKTLKIQAVTYWRYKVSKNLAEALTKKRVTQLVQFLKGNGVDAEIVYSTHHRVANSRISRILNLTATGLRS
jgi:hypothetical protein